MAAEISFFSAVLGAYLVLKRSDSQSAQTCFAAALAIMAAHLLCGAFLMTGYFRKSRRMVGYYGSALLLMGLMAATAKLF
jgi:hypothetical protein